ncbi:MAG: cupin domain-containing protein [Anaerolineae bacterium]
MQRDNEMTYNAETQWLTVKGMIAKDLKTHPLKPRPKRGEFLAARFDELSGNTTIGCHLGEMPGEKNIGHRHVDEAIIFMLTGSGYSILYQADNTTDWPAQHKVEWQAGSLLSIPVNAYHQHFNAEPGVKPVRQLAIKNVPTLRKVFNSRELIYANPFRFYDRYRDEPDYFQLSERVGERCWRTNFVKDMYTFPLDPWPERGEGVSAMYFDMAGMQTLRPHLTELAPGGRTRPHHHLREELILVLSGRGYTRIWQEGGPEVKVEWEAGDLFSPPLNAWHEHVNTDASAAARYYSVENMIVERLFGNERFVSENNFVFHERFNGR